MKKVNGARISRQQLLLFKIPVYHVSYSYEGSEYHLLVYGDNNEIYSTSSPISNTREQYFEGVKKIFEQGDYYQAEKLMDRILEMDVGGNREELLKFKEKISKTIGNQVVMGSMMGTLLSFAVFLPLNFFVFKYSLFFLSHFRNLFIMEPRLIEMHPYTMTRLFFIFLFAAFDNNIRFMKKGMRNVIRDKWERVVISAILCFGRGLVAWLVLFIINATGLPVWLDQLLVRWING